MLKDYVKRLKLEKIMQGSIYALSGGLLAAAIMVMIFQLLGLIEWYFYLISVLGGVVVLFIILSIYYFVNKVSDKEAAKRIDQNFNLREKASTMVEFKGQDSLLINKQREDAQKSIKLKSPKKLILKMTMASLPLPLLGAGAFTTSFFTQDIVNMLKVDEIEDNFDDETDQIIDDIKDYIGKSQASAAFKEKLYQILEELREDLKGDTSIPSRQAKVDAAKEEVDVALDEVNTKEEIGNELLNEESDFTELGTILLEANVDAIEGAFDTILSKLDKIYTTSGLLDYFEEWIKALEHLLKNVDVLNMNGGGITISGGEPLFQIDATLELVKKLKGKTNVALQTCGYGDSEKFKEIIKNLDLVLFDMKIMNKEKAKKLEGIDNSLIFKNLEILKDSNVKFIIRIPLIPGVIDTEENIKEIISYIKGSKNLLRVELLPYNKYAGSKYALAGMKFEPMYDEKVDSNPRLYLFKENGIEARVF